MLVRRDVRVLTIRIGTGETIDDTSVKDAWVEDDVWKDLVLKKDEVFKGVAFQNGQIVVCYEWDEGLEKEDVVERALNWARDVVGALLDEAEEELVGE